MRKYKVYLTTGDTIEVEAERVDGGITTVSFCAKDRVVAMFVYENICGWCELEL